MDDLTLFDTDPNKLGHMIEPVDSWLKDERKHKLNPRKTILKPLKEGIEYLGYRIKQVNSQSEPAKLFLKPKKKWEFIRDIKELELNGLPQARHSHPLALCFDQSTAQKRVASINSRLGMHKHAASFRFRQQALTKLMSNMTDQYNLPEDLTSSNWAPLIVRKDYQAIKIR